MDDELLKKAFKIIEEANDCESNFFANYSEWNNAMGDRQVDYCAYLIPLNDYYELHLSFVDFGLTSFSVDEIKD